MEIKENTSNNHKYIDKVYKFLTKEKREIIGRLKAYNKEGNFYLSDCVEVFEKNTEHYAYNELFENDKEHNLFFDTEKYQYQYINNCIFPLEEVGEIYILKDDIFNKYQNLLDKYYKDIEEKKRIEEEERKKNEENNNKVEEEDNLEVNYEKKKKKKKKKRR